MDIDAGTNVVAGGYGGRAGGILVGVKARLRRSAGNWPRRFLEGQESVSSIRVNVNVDPDSFK